MFPTEFPFQELKPSGFAWKKYYRNPNKYVVLPKYANYKNMEMLVAIFNGNLIDTSKKNIENIDYFLKEKYEDV